MLPAMYDIVHELTIGVPPDQVYEAITTQEGLAGWWTTDTTAEPVIGSVATFALEGHSTVLSMRIELLESPELVDWACVEGPDEWAGTHVTYRIEGDARGQRDGDDNGDDNDGEDDGDGSGAGGSVLRFWHGGWAHEDGELPRSSFQWAMHLDSLRRYCESGTGSPA
jgi:Activator of Hsp90 ATPase homolog 1-like protein